ncbi:dipeptide/oligopeptide/nickel ABC transporter ATP-binding protein [Leptospira kobayashii]|uniref:Dipeptide/oligopeptide/nickel ABC transporter ATP-binding protein n=1 Tax=Leptospira kobayashii TaxID=1917830 RepID=A0ABN6KCI3_9LEPT|nr:ABC transporter ATP-binding protein [Leptospira kobayashii]BDA77354.1 dipeptide/oligopeptide/nickel ABC transporter ATP-binding protein [Leptospira kobayashii]
MSASPLLSVNNLSVQLNTEEGKLDIIKDISFSIAESEIFALVGESGCGKSISSLAMTRLLPANQAIYPTGSIDFSGKDLLRLSSEEMRKIRGKEIAYIFQEPFSSLNPLQRIGEQMIEGFLHHGLGTETEALAKAEYLFQTVGITDAKQRLGQYPNQFSGGMLQRVCIAMALMCDPKLLIADEPTSAIDVTIQLQLIQLLLRLKKEIKMSILFISHDIGLVSHLAQRMAVMYAGRIVEIGSVDEVIDTPKHPYSKALIEAYPSHDKLGKKLQIIEGMVPSPKDYPIGCHFQDRCSIKMEICKTAQPALRKLSDTQSAFCFALGEENVRS